MLVEVIRHFYHPRTTEIYLHMARPHVGSSSYEPNNLCEQGSDLSAELGEQRTQMLRKYGLFPYHP